MTKAHLQNEGELKIKPSVIIGEKEKSDTFNVGFMSESEMILYLLYILIQLEYINMHDLPHGR